MKIAGIDIGTTACKVSLYDAGGALIREIESEYAARSAQSPLEIDLGAVYAAVVGILKQMAPDCGGLAAIGVTSFGETAALLDEEDRLLTNAMLYTDPRGTQEAEEIAGRLGALHVASITGLTPNPMYTLPKLLWLKRHEPALFSRIRKILLIEDYIVYRLTGIRQIDYSLASRTMAFDVRRLQWSGELLRYAGLDAALFSKPVPSGTAAGPLRAELAREIGLPPGTLVVNVAQDQISACVGAGALKPGDAVDSTGTVECITPVYEGFPDPARIQKGRYSVVPFVRPGTYASYAFSYTGGALLKWFRDEMKKRPGEGGFYDEMNARLGDEPSGLMVLPHFAGAGTPYMDPSALGAVVGLTLRSTDADLYRALMEGVAYEMRVNLEALGDAGIGVGRLLAAGGGAKSAAWLQMKADILDLPIVSLGTAQCGTLGSVMLSGVACGIFGSLEEAAGAFVRQGKTYLPRKGKHENYMRVYARYKRLYPALKDVYGA